MPSPDTIILDISKTLLGTFLGAGLAFFSNYLFRLSQKEEEQVAAGNIALAILTRMTMCFLTYKKFVLTTRHKTMKTISDLPNCLHMKPVFTEFDESLEINIQSLTFLINPRTKYVLNPLFLAQAAYKNICYLHKEHFKQMSELQEQLSLLHFDDSKNQIDWAAKINKLPRHAVGRMETLNTSILNSLKEEEKLFFAAIEALRKSLTTHLGTNRILPVNIPKEFRDFQVDEKVAAASTNKS